MIGIQTLECFVTAAVVGVEVCYSINYLRVEVYILKIAFW